jgi:hypothetical protein
MKNVLLVTMLLLSAPAAGLAQTTLFGGVGRGDRTHRGELIIIDQTTGTGTSVGPGAADPLAGLTGLAFSSSGELFASTINAPVFADPPARTPVSTLIRLDPFTGAEVAVIGTIRLADGTPIVINDLALQPGTDVLFGTALNDTGTNDIFTIDTRTAVATFVGDTGVIGATLAFGPDGTLYQTSAEFGPAGFLRGFLNTLDPATGAVLTTSEPFTEAHIGGLAVSPDGVIFGSDGSPDFIYILSPEGGLTQLLTTGFGGVGDLAFTPLLTDKDQCKNGGWRTKFPLTFKNQGACIQYVNTGK